MLVAGCTSYHPVPLNEQLPKDALASLLTSVPVETDKHLPPINLDDGLDLQELASIAVYHSPLLKAQRTQLGVAKAQAFAAGLLPDPQFAVALDHPTNQTLGLVNALSLGLGYSLGGLITHGAKEDAAQAHLKGVRLDLLWQEWQVVNQVQMLAVDILTQQQQLKLLDDMISHYQQRYQRSTEALTQGNVTATTTGTDLTTLLDALSQQSQLRQSLSQSKFQLNLLLGLPSDEQVPLSPLPYLSSLDLTKVQAKRGSIAQHRPDLLALKAGYSSQEANVRAAVLGQFPNLSITLNRSRDTGNLKTSGVAIDMDLPFVDGNRGNIAVERATRAQLEKEYQLRLFEADNQIGQLLAQYQVLATQADSLAHYLPALSSLVNGSTNAFNRGDIDALTYLNMESTYTSKRLEALTINQQQWQIQIALQSLLGQMTTLKESI